MRENLRILFLEDIPHDAEIAIATLEAEGYHCEWERVQSRENFLNRLDGSEYDLVIADYSLPSFDGITAIGLFLERCLDIPFILISGALGEEAAVEVLKAGASDFVLKNRLFRLPDVVNRALKDAKAKRRVKGREQQNRLHAAALESAANAIVITDPNGTITFVNRAFTTLTGYLADEVLHQHMSILRSGEHDSLFYKDLWDTVLAGNVWHGQMINMRKNGSLYAEEQTITPVANELGEIVNFIAVKQDITNRNEAEAERIRLGEEIASERGRLTEIVANVPGVVWEVWSDLRPAPQPANFVSTHVETMLGYGIEEWLATPSFWMDIVHADDKISAAKQSLSILRGGPNQPFEFRWVAKDGHTVWAEAHCAVINNEKGAPVGMRGVTIDVTERKRAEQRFRRLVDSNAQGVFFWNTKGAISGGNNAFLNLTGYTREDMEAGRINWVSMTPPEFADLDQKALAQLAATGVCLTYEKDWIRKDGTRVPVLLGAAMLDDDLNDGVCFAVDLTDRRHLEEQLRQSQKMESIGVLAGGIAHDFNNLLTAINGYSEMTLAKMEANSPMRHNIEQVSSAGKRAALLTGQLLAFSRKQVLKPVVHNLNTVLADTEKMLRRIIGENIELRTTLDPKLGNIKADPGQIEQVILNLAVNARDAMPDGGMLTIETQSVHLDQSYVNQHLTVAPGPFVRLIVTDNGQGMDAKTQKRIFEPFFTTKEIGKGTGLGLSTAYGIIKQSGGDILVYSEVGHGSTFKAYLPSVDDMVQQPKLIDDGEENFSGTETILVVEDEDAVRNLICEILTESGYKVLEADRGHAALELCDSYNHPIHLLLTDVIMPRMGGSELRDHVIKTRPDIKVIFMSGYTDDAVAKSGILESGNTFIEKPFSPDSLSRMVRDALDF